MADCYGNTWVPVALRQPPSPKATQQSEMDGDDILWPLNFTALIRIQLHPRCQ